MKKLLLNALVLIVFAVLGKSNATAQGVYNMCATTSTTDSTGTLYDSGGPLGEYLVNEDCTLYVAPSCATSITLTFQSFATEATYDFFHVYDGPTPASPEILVADGNVIPGPVTCTSGFMTIVFHSDFTIVDSGFACTWTSVIAPSVAPTAAFAMSDVTPPLGVNVNFTDQSVGGTTGWLWYFGDGDTARSQNPHHAYSSPGAYTVTLISFQCSESDTISHNITVQAAPQISVTPMTGFTANVQCGDSATFNMDVSNVAGGQLVYGTDGASVGKIRVLAMTYGSDPFSEFPHTISAIHHYFNNDTIITTSTTNPGTLSGLLVGKNVLLIPEQESGSPAVWTTLGPVIQQFLNNGGSVIFCGSNSSEANCMFNTGVFSGTFSQNAQNQTVDILIPGDSLVKGISGTSFSAPSASYTMQISNTDKVKVVDFNGDDVVTWRYYGSGKAIFIAFDYFDSVPESGKIIANAIEWGGKNALPSWIHITPAHDTVNAGGTSNGTVTFVAGGFPAGTYYANIGIASNDPNNPVVLLPCTLSVSGLPFIALSDTCLPFGQVMQNTTVRDTFRITNSGCDTLVLSNIVSTNNSFSVTGNIPYLLPGAFADIVVTLLDTAVHVVNGAINIFNNDADTSICLSASISPSPKVNTSTNALSDNLRACSQTGTSTFVLKNTGLPGAVPLTFTLGAGLPAWITANPTSGSLPPGDSVVITLNYGSGTFAGGPQSANVVIASNDPGTPNKIVAFTMNVDYNPCNLSYVQIPNTCTGFSAFTSSCINIPTSYLWDFGDGTTDTVANPNHGYPNNGTFVATLIACNASGCDTVVDTVHAVITGPKATGCYPTTIAYCCGIGVTLFQVNGPFGLLFNKTSPDAIDGYKDYTCTDYASLVTNYPYDVNINTGFTYVEKVRMWLDMNNDGVLDSVAERLYDLDALTTHQGTINIPALPTNVYGEPLRLRIASDYIGNATPQPCLNLQFGQVEDYAVFLSFYDGVNEVARETGFNVYPNPFSQSTNIEYNLKNSSDVSVEVFNILGEKVSTFAATEMQTAGKHSYQFNGKPSGVYFVKLTVDEKSSVLKIIKM